MLRGLFALSAAVYGAAAAPDRVVAEADASAATVGLPEGWSAVQRSPPEQGLELLFAVKQQNLAELEATLLRVSDPRSKHYGQHLSNEQVHALVAPAQTDLQAVQSFLEAHGVVAEALSPNSDFLQAKVTVAQAEKMFACEYHEMLHTSGLSVHRTMGYSLPPAVAHALDFVAPTVHLPPPARKLRVKDVRGAAPLVGNSPSQLRTLYSVGLDTVGQAPENRMAVTAFLEQNYHEADLKEFWGEFCSSLTCGKGVPKLVGDQTTGLRAGVESMLDIETITGVAGNVSSEFWGFSGRSPDNKENEPFMKWLAQMANTSDAVVPKIFSTSYGENEASWSLDAATRMNTEFQKAGVRGISLLYASGDEGANCIGDKYKPETPGSSPWVTSVGGTQGAARESAIGLSSGGFSDRWPMPDWQSGAVKAYLSSAKSLPDKSTGYNAQNRAYPDISAQASDFTVVANLVPLPGVAGTSCASPTAAGVVALLNDALLQAGKPTLGFLNPWIYQNMDKWNDIATGASDGCLGLEDGWPAAKGWDAVTGVGTPNYKKLLAAALSAHN